MFGSNFLKQFGIPEFPFENVDPQGGMFGVNFGFAGQPPQDPTAPQPLTSGAPIQPASAGPKQPLTSGAPIQPTPTAIPGRAPAPALGAPPKLGGSVLSPSAMSPMALPDFAPPPPLAEEQPDQRAPAAGIGTQFDMRKA